jgi:hypothetical protein
MISYFLKLKMIGKAFLSAAYAICFANTTLAACYTTPLHAIAAITTRSSLPKSESGGYRVVKIQSDLVLGQAWASIIDCGHPLWPAVAFQLSNSHSPIRLSAQDHVTNVYSSTVIRAGEIVRLWRQETFLRIEIAGVSESNGRLGDRVRVRLLCRNTDENLAAKEFYGVVRGPSDVEMKP